MCEKLMLLFCLVSTIVLLLVRNFVRLYTIILARIENESFNSFFFFLRSVVVVTKRLRCMQPPYVCVVVVIVSTVQRLLWHITAFELWCHSEAKQQLQHNDDRDDTTK